MKKLFFYTSIVLVVIVLSFCKNELQQNKKLDVTMFEKFGGGNYSGNTIGFYNSYEQIKYKDVLSKYIGSSMINKYDHIVGVCLYAQEQFRDYEKLKGNYSFFSLYTYENNQLKHHLFKRENDSFSEIREFNLNTGGISVTYNSYIMTYLRDRFESKAENIYYIIDRATPYSLSSSFEELGLKCRLGKYRSQNSGTREPVQCADGPCDGSPGCSCEVYSDPGDDGATGGDIAFCEACACGNSIIQGDTTLLSNYTAQFYNLYIQPSVAYNIRDSFLINFALGNKYIEYYYDISYFLKNNNSFLFSHKIKILNNLPTLFSLVDRLKNNSTSNSAFLSAQEKLDLIDLVNTLKSISNNSDYTFMLNDVLADIDSVSNKTVAQVHQQLF